MPIVFPTTAAGNQRRTIDLLAVVSNDAQGNGTPIIVGYAQSEGFRDENVIGPNDNFYQRTQGRYPYFIQLHSGKYLNAPIKYGISLIELCRDLGPDLYPNGKQHPEEILSTHHQKSHIQITEKAREYIIKNLDERIEKYGG